MKSKFAIASLLLIGTMTACHSGSKPSVMDNPLLTEFTTPYGVPPFNLIQPQHYTPAFTLGMEEQMKAVESIINNKEEPTFENTIVALDQSGELLAKVSRIFFGLTEANTNDSIQKIQVAITPVYLHTVMLSI